MFYAWLGFALTCRDKPNEAYQYLLKALKIGEGINNQKVIGYACAWLTWTCAGLGLFREGIKYGKRAQEIAKKFETDHYLFFKSLAGISYNYEFCGDYKKCSEIGKVLIEYGKNHSNVRCLVAGNISMGEVYYISGKLPRAIEFYKKAAEVSADPMYYYWGSLKLGFSYAFNGQIQEAEKVLQEVTSFGTNFGHQMLGHPARTCYGAVLMAKGEMAKGLKLIEKTNENYLETDQKLLQAITEQLLGRIFLQIVEGAGPINLKLIIKNIGFLIRYVPIAAKKAEHHLNNAIRIAKEIGAKGILGQATLDLGLLYKAKKQTDLARKNITGAMEILKQCEAEVLLKQAKETLESLG
jgi:tetratricopeptide (TPR) repeat protein